MRRMFARHRHPSRTGHLLNDSRSPESAFHKSEGHHGMSMRLTIQCPIRHRTLSPNDRDGTKNQALPVDRHGRRLVRQRAGGTHKQLVQARAGLGNKPCRTADELERATMRWVSWYNSKRLHASLGHRTPQDVENEYHRQQTAQAVSQ
ncbi:hypothetical protein COO72_09430 [Bifidobacterium callitrichos]|nr:hypothetical protein COO72_09430 [Bifidobacterium callitrichos]